MMIFRAASLAAALFLAATPVAAKDAVSQPPTTTAGAHGNPLLTLLQQVCMGHSGDRAGAMAEAQSQGFTRPPRSVLEDMESDSEMQDADMRMRLVEDGVQIVITGVMNMPRVGAFDACAVADTSPASQRTATEVGDWLGLQRIELDDPGDDTVVFVFLEDANGRRTDASTLSESEAARSLREGRMRVVFVGGDAEIRMIGYGVARNMQRASLD